MWCHHHSFGSAIVWVKIENITCSSWSLSYKHMGDISSRIRDNAFVHYVDHHDMNIITFCYKTILIIHVFSATKRKVRKYMVCWSEGVDVTMRWCICCCKQLKHNSFLFLPNNGWIAIFRNRQYTFPERQLCHKMYMATSWWARDFSLWWVKQRRYFNKNTN